MDTQKLSHSEFGQINTRTVESAWGQDGCSDQPLRISLRPDLIQLPSAPDVSRQLHLRV